MIHDLAYRGDHSCGSAQAALCEVIQLFETDLALLGFQAKIMLSDIDQ